MPGSGGLVIGTAGHIDHGKTSLIRALTGIDTDRLAEEKRRGISIDLGFAHLVLPDGTPISFVDVPGHERFIKNMLAGVGGIQAVLLIVAADESIKPQTREHFDICRLLALQHGIVVLTKIDAATPEQIARTRRDLQALCAGSFLERAPVVKVSSVTGQGLDTLRNELARLAREVKSRDGTGLARLPVDRCFALKGFGTVVTGTLWSGEFRTGDTIEVFPSERTARVRGLQVHGTAVDVAHAGQRLAVNLTGTDSSEIRRGFVLTHKDGLQGTKTLDVAIEWLDRDDAPTARAQFLCHIGTAEIPAQLKSIGAPKAFARVWLREPVLALPGDRFVLRRPSPAQTVGGGMVVDPFPPVRLNRVKTIARLEGLYGAAPASRVQMLVEEAANGRRLPDLVRLTGVPPGAIQSQLVTNPRLLFIEAGQRAVSKEWVQRMRQQLVNWLAAFHAKNPAAIGAPIAAARLNLEPSLAAAIFKDFPAIRVHGETVSLASHKAQASPKENENLLKIERAFRQAGLQPPPPAEVMRSVGSDLKADRGLLETLIKSQKLVRISDDLIFHAEAIAQIRHSLTARKNRKFSVPEFKEWTQVSRKYAIPLLEYLDRQHVTRREGDSRIVL
jgi:selenocysteine-specific elongation factor